MLPLRWGNMRYRMVYRLDSFVGSPRQCCSVTRSCLWPLRHATHATVAMAGRACPQRGALEHCSHNWRRRRRAFRPSDDHKPVHTEAGTDTAVSPAAMPPCLRAPRRSGPSCPHLNQNSGIVTSAMAPCVHTGAARLWREVWRRYGGVGRCGCGCGCGHVNDSPARHSTRV